MAHCPLATTSVRRDVPILSFARSHALRPERSQLDAQTLSMSKIPGEVGLFLMTALASPGSLSALGSGYRCDAQAAFFKHSVVGYNPSKPGRPSLRSFWIAHLRLCRKNAAYTDP